MNSFSYLVPTKVIFGKDALDSLAAELSQYEPNKVLVLYGSGSVVRNGVLKKVTDILDGSNISYLAHGGVKANPVLSFVYSTKDLCLSENIDFILAVGGGSVLDTAKAVAHATANPTIDVWDFFEKGLPISKSLPVAAVLTISAAGSETSNSSVITNEETTQKRGFRNELNRPKFAILNPEFTFTLPKYQVSCGVVDIMMHTLDRYFARPYDNEITNQIAEAVIRTVMMYGQQAVDNPYDYESMSEIMWCGSVSHNGLTGLGSVMDFSPHQLGHSLSGIYDVAHGASLSVCWGGFAEYVYKSDVARFARYARNVFGLTGDNDEILAKQGIEKTKEFFASLNMPLTITELLKREPSDDEIENLAISCSYNKTRKVGTFLPLDYNDMKQIYTSIK